MKRTFFSAALMAASLLLASCGGSSLLSQGGTTGTGLLGTGALTGGSSTGSALTTGLNSLLGNLLSSSSALTQNDLVGTWTYQSADCVFETENFLAKAGGEIAAASIEEKLNAGLEKVGIKKGTCKFTFNKDNTYSAQIGSRTINGQYTLDSANKTLKLTYLNGLGTMTPHIARNGSKISLLIDSDKLLTLVKAVSAFSNNSTIKTASELLSNYDGLYVGLQMSK
ncbi:MAG: DUF4923 family protein [Alloprevotella sp.]